MAKKIQLIFWPFLRIAFTFIVLYSFFNWLLVNYTEILPLKEDLANIWLPFFLAWIPVLISLRPRIRLLKFNGAGEKKAWLYTLFAVIAIAVPAIFAQLYLQKAAGTMKKLWSINSINTDKPSKYYTLKNYYIDKKDIGMAPSFELSGSANEYLDIQLYVVLPILESENDTVYSSCLGWIGMKYAETISNKLSDAEKEEAFNAFAERCLEDIESKDVSQFVYLELIGNNADNDAYQAALQTSYKSSSGPIRDLVFHAVNQPFAERTGNRLLWLWISLAIGVFGWLGLSLIPQLEETEYHQVKKKLQSEDKELREVLEFFKPNKDYFITPMLIYLNVLVFLAMVLAGLGFMSFDPGALLNWGANLRIAVLSGEWWRLLSATFLHGGAIHLLANMYGLLFIGIILEPLLGKAKYLTVYLLTGILASCASIWWKDNAVSVGASGAIFGLYGLFLSLLLKKQFLQGLQKQFILSTIIFIGYNLLMGFRSESTDNAAHIGGLVSGFLAGLVLSPMLKPVDKIKTINDLFVPVEPTPEVKTGMTRADYVAICKQCKHKELDLNLGIICGLTKKQADFEEKCRDFSI